MKKTSTKVSNKKIAQLQAQINIIQSEIDILRGDCIEFDSNDPLGGFNASRLGGFNASRLNPFLPHTSPLQETPPI